MNKCFKPVFYTVVLAVFGAANAQEAPAPAAPAHTPAATHAPAVPAPAAPAPTPAVPAVPAPAPVPAAETHAPAHTAPAHAPAAEAHAPTVEAPVAVPVAPVAETPAPEAPVAEAVPAPQAGDSAAAVAPTEPAEVILVVQEPPPRKKKRGQRSPKNDFAVVDVPADFEIQARKVMPLDSKEWPDDNLNEWWGRANLMVLTESENFIGKIHLRMYPGEFREPTYLKGKRSDGRDSTISSFRDVIELYEAWAWHKGDYFNVKIGRWDNTSRFGSMAYGGYIDAKRDNDYIGKPGETCNGNTGITPECRTNRSKNRKAEGFMSSYDPENALQFGFYNFAENISLDLALVSGDKNLNSGDLRVHFNFRDLAGIESMNFGIGYRSNVFDGIYDKTTDVTHTISLGFRMPLVKDAGLLKALTLFGEAALIGLDDQVGTETRADGGGIPSDNNPIFPLLGGLDISLYRGLDKIVIEAEFDNNRRNKTPGDRYYNDKKVNVRDVQGSIYVQRKLNDRFTLNLGMQSEHNTKDFSFAANLLGRIN